MSLTELPFRDRVDAGRRLAARLAHLRGADPVVLGIPRGGVPVAFSVANALGATLDVVIVRKLGTPGQPELGLGAIGEAGVRVLDDEIVRLTGTSEREIAVVEQREREELARRALQFRGDRPPVEVADRCVIIVDDGIATGSTARAACRIVAARGAARVVLAVPVAPPGWTERFRGDADELIALETPAGFHAVGQWYRDFSATSDREVVTCLQKARTHQPAATTPSFDGEVEIPCADKHLRGRFTVPPGAPGIVVFAHGSGSSRHSPRNRFVAEVLQRAGLGTLLFDLLTPAEERDRAKVFDIGLLADRLVTADRWLRAMPAAHALPLAYFGASTGAGAALYAAGDADADVAAVVSRGGRPDLAGSRLGGVRCPVLLIVGANDDVVLALNREAQSRLGGVSRLEVVPGASHLFEEPGTLQQAAQLARDWFLQSFPLR